MEWVETTGRTIEDAKEAALDQLGVDDTDAEFVVVSEPRAGLFGRLRGEARVRARVRPTSPRPKRTRSRRQPAEQRDQRQQRQRTGGSTSAGRRGRSAEKSVALVDGESAHEAGGAAAEESSNGSTASRRHRRTRGRRGGSSRTPNSSANGAGAGTGEGDGKAAPSRTSKGDRSPASTKEEEVGETLSLGQQGDAARDFLAGLVRELGVDASVSVRVVDDDTAEVVVDGHELGLLIGPGGATLAALQELARTYVQKETGGHSSRILVDVAGYRAKRAAALQRFTRQIAEEVLSSGSEQALEPMSASDRKVVHDTVNDIEGLATRSEGEDPRRFIVISPSGPPQ
jgi:spoIIIJ-associated protein